MKCEWNKLLAILPAELRTQVDRFGRESLQELRIRQGRPTQLVMGTGDLFLDDMGTADTMNFVINTASRYSPWAATSISHGYITAPGGHRIGICGEVVVRDGVVNAIRNPTSLCVRIARDFPGIAAKASRANGNILIVGPPGSGKTTLLRDLIRQFSNQENGCVAVVDEREELFPPGCGFGLGIQTDVLSGCGKPDGIEMALRTMGPAIIAVDEITSEPDCDALEQALWCGVRLVATAHATSRQDLHSRRIYRRLARGGSFDTLLVLQQDKSWTMERM